MLCCDVRLKTSVDSTQIQAQIPEDPEPQESHVEVTGVYSS